MVGVGRVPVDDKDIRRVEHGAPLRVGERAAFAEAQLQAGARHQPNLRAAHFLHDRAGARRGEQAHDRRGGAREEQTKGRGPVGGGLRVDSGVDGHDPLIGSGWRLP